MKEDTPTPVLEPTERPQSKLTSTDPKVVSDRYTILDILGTGGMGRVYLALDPILFRKVAVKILLYDEFSEAHIVRFQQEAKAFSQLKHPGIVDAYDFGITKENKPFLVMEYIEGQLLSEMLAETGFLERDQFVEIFSQIAKAMVHAHNQNIVHRDLKPTNIMVKKTADGLQAFVLDFGIAKDLQQSQELTKTGQIVGSPKYISPEQVLGKRLQASSDIYSLGCVMFEALTGRAPFVGNNSMETLEMHLEKDPPTLNEVVGYEKYTQNAEELIARLLAKDARERIQSMEELAEILATNNLTMPIVDLEEEQHAKSDNSNGDLESAVKIKSKPNMLIMSLVALLITTILGGIFWYLQKPKAIKADKPLPAVPRRPFVSSTEEIQLKREKKLTAYGSNDYMAMAMGDLRKDIEVVRLFGSVVTDTTVKIDLVQYKQLRAVDFDYSKITPSSISFLTTIRKLQYLKISNSDYSGGAYRVLRRSPKLKGLWLINCDLTDKDLKEISKISNLEILVLRGNSNITNKGMKHLLALTNLRKLEVSDSITKRGLKSFSKLRNLVIYTGSNKNLSRQAQSKSIVKSKIDFYDTIDGRQLSP